VFILLLVFLKESLTEEFLDEFVKHASTKPDSVSMALNDVRGASSTKKELDYNAFVGRKFTWELNIMAIFPPHEDEKAAIQKEADIKWIKEVHQSMEKFTFYNFNYFNHANIADVTYGKSLGPNEERVSKLKAEYDPSNLFLALRDKSTN